MSGTIPLSMTQQSDIYGKPLAGGMLYCFVAGTVSTPQNPYQDSGLTLPWPNPIILDAAGRIPQFFLADGLIKVRLTDSVGVVQLVADNVQVVGASSGGGGGATIDPTTIYQTGDLKPRYSTGTHTGWVRANGNSIGNSGSAATELANDLQALALFQHLWNIDLNLAVSGGRGASATADFNGGKRLTLPDWRGRTFAGLDGMGNTVGVAGRLTATYFGASGIVLGAAGGDEKHLITQGQLPNVSLSITIPAGQGAHTHNTTTGGNTIDGPGSPDEVTSVGTADAVDGAISKTLPQIGPGNWVSLGGSGLNHNNTQPTMLVTIYIKL